MRKRRVSSIARRIGSLTLLWAGVSILVFLATVARDVLENAFEIRRSARR